MMVYRRISISLLFSTLIILACGAPPQFGSSDDLVSREDRQKLVAVAGGYLGTPYRYGGMSTKGFDCSGLVYRIYRQAIGWKIPRTTEGQFERSVKINSGQAKAGDLVFFRINGSGIDHVGMMINNYQFIHSSKSLGVIISDFGDEYYRKYFSSIRRLR
jgi:cell wall-associated NlpC family hydrolase